MSKVISKTFKCLKPRKNNVNCSKQQIKPMATNSKPSISNQLLPTTPKEKSMTNSTRILKSNKKKRKASQKTPIKSKIPKSLTFSKDLKTPVKITDSPISKNSLLDNDIFWKISPKITQSLTQTYDPHVYIPNDSTTVIQESPKVKNIEIRPKRLTKHWSDVNICASQRIDDEANTTKVRKKPSYSVDAVNLSRDIDLLFKRADSEPPKLQTIELDWSDEFEFLQLTQEVEKAFSFSTKPKFSVSISIEKESPSSTTTATNPSILSNVPIIKRNINETLKKPSNSSTHPKNTGRNETNSFDAQRNLQKLSDPTKFTSSDLLKDRKTTSVCDPSRTPSKIRTPSASALKQTQIDNKFTSIKPKQNNNALNQSVGNKICLPKEIQFPELKQSNALDWFENESILISSQAIADTYFNGIKTTTSLIQNKIISSVQTNEKKIVSVNQRPEKIQELSKIIPKVQNISENSIVKDRCSSAQSCSTSPSKKSAIIDPVSGKDSKKDISTKNEISNTCREKSEVPLCLQQSRSVANQNTPRTDDKNQIRNSISTTDSWPDDDIFSDINILAQLEQQCTKTLQVPSTNVVKRICTDDEIARKREAAKTKRKIKLACDLMNTKSILKKR